MGGRVDCILLTHEKDQYVSEILLMLRIFDI
jgi:hypothetical protein